MSGICNITGSTNTNPPWWLAQAAASERFPVCSIDRDCGRL